jgi:hypothetical protein
MRRKWLSQERVFNHPAVAAKSVPCGCWLKTGLWRRAKGFEVCAVNNTNIRRTLCGN